MSTEEISVGDHITLLGTNDWRAQVTAIATNRHGVRVCETNRGRLLITAVRPAPPVLRDSDDWMYDF